jgi:RNA-directed DNA polymerase
MMHESVVVAAKPTNKAERPAAELVELRTGIKENAGQQSACRAQDRESVSQVLERVTGRRKAREEGEGALRSCTYQSRDAESGVLSTR